MRDMGLVKVDEPFTKLLTQGMVLNEAFHRIGDKTGKRYYWAHELDIERDEHANVISAKSKDDGQPVTYEGWTTMSKSKNNGVDPQDLIDKYGADTARLYTMFTAPPEATLEWNDAALEGSFRFLRRVWMFGHKMGAAGAAPAASATGAQSKALRREIHTVLRQVDYDYQRMQYNTVVSGAMKLLNALEGFKGAAEPHANAAVREGFGILLRVLYPVTPHIAHTLWQELGYGDRAGELLDAPWPQVDEEALKQDEIELVLQVNGKHRGSITVPAGASREEIEAAGAKHEAVAQFGGGKPPKKIVVVPGRLVNVVV
jgi:leucyl-tRNA synthetase